MKNFIPGYQGAAGNTKIKVIKATSPMSSPPVAGNDCPRLNSTGLTWEPVMSKGIRARMATMQMWIRRQKKQKPVMDQRRMWRTESIVDLT